MPSRMACVAFLVQLSSSFVGASFREPNHGSIRFRERAKGFECSIRSVERLERVRVICDLCHAPLWRRKVEPSQPTRDAWRFESHVDHSDPSPPPLPQSLLRGSQDESPSNRSNPSRSTPTISLRFKSPSPSKSAVVDLPSNAGIDTLAF